MSSLPAGPVDPLHILEPGPEVWPKVLAILLLLGALLFWMLRRSQKRPTEQAVTPPPPVEAVSETVHFVDQIRERFDREGDFRRGCHALAEGLRNHLATETGKKCEHLTRQEIENQVGNLPEVPVLELLAGWQFRRQEPGRKDFHQACDLTRVVSGGVALDLKAKQTSSDASNSVGNGDP